MSNKVSSKFPPLPSVSVSCLDERQVYQNLLVPVVTVAWPTEKSIGSQWFHLVHSRDLSLSTQSLHSLSQADVKDAHHDKEEVEDVEYYESYYHHC